MKKIFVTGLAVIALVGISIPVIASSALKGDIRVDGRVQEMDTKNTETDEAAECRCPRRRSPMSRQC